MSIDLTSYLEHLASVTPDVEDVEDSSHRSRIQWYIDYVINKVDKEEFPEHRWRRIFKCLYSIEGRESWAVCLVEPVVDSIQRSRVIIESRGDVRPVLRSIRNSTISCENFFSILTEVERFSESVCRIRSMVRDLYNLYEQAQNLVEKF